MTLSIITINYNNKDGLLKTIDSVMSQTWREFEWIIIDGGSTDGSKEVIEDLAANPDANISYWCSEPDKGVYNAQNKGILHASGDYMNFMNSGDTFYDKDTLKNVSSQLKDDDVIYGDWLWAYPDHEELAECPHEATLTWLQCRNICHQAMFIKSTLLKEEGYDENYRLLADWARWMKMASEGRSFKYVPYIICRFAMGGLSGNGGALTVKETQWVKQIPPIHIQKALKHHEDIKNELDRYKEYPFNQEAFELMHERIIYRRILHGFVIITRWIKKFVDVFNPTPNQHHKR